ncbi:MAG: hypothetical protein QOG09_429 [Solirubrobacterales bacterium]|nr:hypothetical protein [Solirubrobacterales bacterium]
MHVAVEQQTHRPNPVAPGVGGQSRSPRLEGAGLLLLATAFSCLAIRLPYLKGAPSLPFLYLALIPYVVIAVIALAVGPVRKRDGALTALIAAFVALLAVALLRVGRTGVPLDFNVALYQATVWMTLGLFGLVAFARLGDDAIPSLLLAICAAPALYVAANVALDALGVQAGRAAPPEAGDPATLLNSLGVAQTRHFFPLAAGVNNFGDVAGAAASGMAVLMVRLRSAGRVWAGVGLLVAIYALLLTDSRAALFLALAAAAGVLLIPAAARGGIRGWALLVPASPALLLGGIGLLAGSDLVGTLARNPGESFGTNRLLIWEPVLGLLGSFSPEHLIGYGAYGQFKSGVSLQYAYLFDIFYTNRYFVGAHNLALQTVLDLGYVGLVVLVVLLARAFGNIARYAANGGAPAAATLAVLIYFPLIGVTESTPTIYTPEALTTFILAVCAAAVLAGSGAHSPNGRARSG